MQWKQYVPQNIITILLCFNSLKRMHLEIPLANCQPFRSQWFNTVFCKANEWWMIVYVHVHVHVCMCMCMCMCMYHPRHMEVQVVTIGHILMWLMEKSGWTSLIRDPLTGPPSHWSPISLVPFSLFPQLIGPPIHYWSSLVPHLIGPPYHWSPISLVPLFISHPIIGQSQWSPMSLVPHLIGPPSH